jgi:hypothetical protein
MDTLSRTNAAAWCKRFEIPLDDRGYPSPHGPSERFDIPADSGQRVHMVTDRLPAPVADETLLWFTGWGVWPSSERPHIFERFRASYGEHRPLAEAPAHVFRREESEDLLSFVTLGVLFLWDLYVVVPQGHILHFSHDEYGWYTQQTAV